MLWGISFLSGCTTHTTNVLTGCQYDEEKDQTDYFVLPYGQVSIPGKWQQAGFNSTSRQQFFKNEEGITLTVSFVYIGKYEFNKDRSKQGFEFVKSNYEWESVFFKETYGLQSEMIEQDSVHNYIVWRLYGEYGNSSWDTYFLFGIRDGIADNFSVMKTDKWKREQNIVFLKELYQNRIQNK